MGKIFKLNFIITIIGKVITPYLCGFSFLLLFPIFYICHYYSKLYTRRSLLLGVFLKLPPKKSPNLEFNKKRRFFLGGITSGKVVGF